MKRSDWETWRDATGPAKARALAVIVRNNEPLAEKLAVRFIQQTNHYVEHIRDDLFQAARVGLLRAVEKFDPDRGAFSTVVGFWALHEMQNVLQLATPINKDKKAFLPRKKQEAAARFYANHGRWPTPEELGITSAAARKAELASFAFTGLQEAVESIASDDAPEETLDRKRMAERLKAFLATLSEKDQRAFWTGRRPDLTARAKVAAGGYSPEEQDGTEGDT